MDCRVRAVAALGGCEDSMQGTLLAMSHARAAMVPSQAAVFVGIVLSKPELDLSFPCLPCYLLVDITDVSSHLWTKCRIQGV